MTSSRSALIGGLTLAISLAAALPVCAVEIRHTNRAEGDPVSRAAPARSDALRPTDTTGPRQFDKRHDGAN